MEEIGLLSIIVPVFNVEKYMDQCIQSILAQNYRNIQLILVDDGSTDRSGEKCDEWKKDSRVTVVHKENGGVSSARNEGIKAARGEYITFVDADDYLSADLYEEVVRQIEDNDADVGMFGYINTYEDYEKIDNPFRKEILTGSEAIRDCIDPNGWQLFVWNKIFKRNIVFCESDNFIKYPTDLIIGEDALWLLECLIRCSKVVCSEACGYHYRKNREGSAVYNSFNSGRIKGCKSRLEAGERGYEFLKQNGEKTDWMMYRRAVFSMKDLACETYMLGDLKENKAYLKRLKEGLKKYSRMKKNGADIAFITKCRVLFILMTINAPKIIVNKCMKL